MIETRDKILLITGGTGSFGRALLEKIIGWDFKEIRIFSRDELKQELMRKEFTNTRLKFHIGDVRSRESVDKVMAGVDYVFHAAALKQVPSCEFFPYQAILTNIIGGGNVIDCAVKHKVRRVVCLSTDKAVYPVNAMGMTKALMEKIAQAESRNVGNGETIISCVRYGNVMCSRGSVIPLFVRQIQAGEAITITDPKMTRFLLSLQDAIDLVLFAFEHAQQGDVFIRKAPACSVGDLATALQNLFDSEVPVRSIGVRHGEKLHETLATAGELRRAEGMYEYFRVRPEDMDLNYNRFFTEGDLEGGGLMDYTSTTTRQLSVPEIAELIRSLPEMRLDLGKGRS
jgi:UDP-glucose 4-epimerase